ncbi:MAG: hypothetical protein WCC14_17290 [Acidobacteriaceae bacterium]
MEAEVFVALAGAAIAGALPVAQGAGTETPGFRSVHAGALGEGRENAAAIRVEAELEQFGAVAVVEEDFSRGALAVNAVEVLRREPAGFRHVGGRLREWAAEELALLLVTILVEAPDIVEAGVGADVLDGTEETAIGGLEDFGDGLGEGLLLLGGLEARGTRQGVGDDLAGVEDFAGADGVDGFGEEALDDLGAEDLKGFEVFKERDGDVAASGKDGVAVLRVADAEVLATEGVGLALASGDGEGAAANGARAEDGIVGDGLRRGRHGGPLAVRGWRLEISVQLSAFSVQRSGIRDQRSAIRDQLSAFSVQGSGFSVR